MTHDKHCIEFYASRTIVFLERAFDSEPENMPFDLLLFFYNPVSTPSNLTYVHVCPFFFWSGLFFWHILALWKRSFTPFSWVNDKTILLIWWLQADSCLKTWLSFFLSAHWSWSAWDNDSRTIQEIFGGRTPASEHSLGNFPPNMECMHFIRIYCFRTTSSWRLISSLKSTFHCFYWSKLFSPLVDVELVDFLIEIMIPGWLNVLRGMAASICAALEEFVLTWDTVDPIDSLRTTACGASEVISKQTTWVVYRWAFFTVLFVAHGMLATTFWITAKILPRGVFMVLMNISSNISWSPRLCSWVSPVAVLRQDKNSGLVCCKHFRQHVFSDSVLLQVHEGSKSQQLIRKRV